MRGARGGQAPDCHRAVPRGPLTDRALSTQSSTFSLGAKEVGWELVLGSGAVHPFLIMYPLMSLKELLADEKTSTAFINLSMSMCLLILSIYYSA